MTPIEKLERYIRRRYETNESFENLVASLKEEQKKQMIGFHKWMLKMDTETNAEQFFHYTDEDMAEMFLDEWGPGWRDLSKDLEGSPQDPAICNYSGLRPIEGYKEIEDNK